MTEPVVNETVLNVLYELPNLVIGLKKPDRTHEFAFEDTFTTTLEQAQAKYADRRDEVLFLSVNYASREERDGTFTSFKSHNFAVTEVQSQDYVDKAHRERVLMALCYRALAEMDFALRQWHYRKADPQPCSAVLMSYDGELLVATLASEFLPH